jgi:hypothetical protein
MEQTAVPSPPATEARRPRRAWPIVVAVLAGMALLAGGWPLISSMLPDSESLPADIGLRLGPEPQEAALLPLAGDGWRISKSESNPDQQYALRHGAVGLEVSYVQLEQPADADGLWDGLRKLGELSDSTFGPPAPGRSARGLPTEEASVTEDGLTGTVTVYVHPDRSYAIVLKELGRPDAPQADRAAVRAAVQGLTFEEPR